MDIFNSKLAKLILAKGYNAITLGCISFYKYGKEDYRADTLYHEKIHRMQWLEVTLAWILLFFWCNLVWLAPIMFYVIYLVDYGFKRLRNDQNTAYRKILFEKEAYYFEDKGFRKIFGWLRFG